MPPADAGTAALDDVADGKRGIPVAADLGRPIDLGAGIALGAAEEPDEAGRGTVLEVGLVRVDVPEVAVVRRELDDAREGRADWPVVATAVVALDSLLVERAMDVEADPGVDAVDAGRASARGARSEDADPAVDRALEETDVRIMPLGRSVSPDAVARATSSLSTFAAPVPGGLSASPALLVARDSAASVDELPRDDRPRCDDVELART